MKTCFLYSWLLVLLAAPAAGQPAVRDHREAPGAAAQWMVDEGAVDSLSLHRLYNTEREKHLSGQSSSSLVWEDTRPGNGKVFFENCTRPGEVIYSSDLVAIRFGSSFVAFTGGTLGPAAGRACEFRLVPSRRGLVPAGSGDGRFAVYNIRAHRYLVYKGLPLPIVGGATSAALTLRWQETANGRPPSNVAARADLVPIDLFFTASKAGDPQPAVYLTIKNIGNVATSASQNEVMVRIRGQEKKFLVLPPISPGGTRQNPLRFDGPLGHCEQILVELDTNPGLKFQVGKGAFPNNDVFANDRKMMPARDIRAAEHAAHGTRAAEHAVRGRAILSPSCGDPGRIDR